MRRTTVDRVLLAVALGGLAGLVIWRVAAHGLLPIAPDDAEYIGVGRRLLSLQTPTRVNGELYTIRSWVWPALTGAASKVVPGDVFRGPKALGVGLGLTALLGASFFAYRRRGGVAAVTTAAMLGITAVVWEVVGSTRVDVALVGFLVVTIVVAAEPSPRRVVLAGVLAGLTLLVKESSALLVLLPFAWWRREHLRAWWHEAWKFWLAFALAVSWWFVFILVRRGEVFPLQGLLQAVHRDVPRAWAPNSAAWVLVATWAVAVVVLVVRARREVGVRVLLIAVLAMLPAATIAWTKELALRQFAPIAILGAIAVGVAVGDLLAVACRRLERPKKNVVRAVAGVAIAAVAVVPIVHLQRDSVFVNAPILDLDTAAWLRDHTRPGAAVAASFRFEATTWARVGERNDFDLLDFKSRPEAPEIGEQVWLDWSDGAFHSLARHDLQRDAHRADVVLLTGRHRLGPIALAVWLDAHGAEVGLPQAAAFGQIGTPGWVHVYRAGAVDVAAVPTLVTTAALDHLSDDQVRSLGDFVVAGTPETLADAAGRLRALGVTPEQLPTPPE